MPSFSKVSLVLVALASFLWNDGQAFQPTRHGSFRRPGWLLLRTTSSATTRSPLVRFANNQQNDYDDGNKQYRNVGTEILSKFMQDKDTMKTPQEEEKDPLAAIDFSAPKQPVSDLETLAAVLDYELYESEWFVTGKVNPVYFADTFRFQDPDVTLDGIEAYARGVRTIFDQATSRAEIIETVVNTERGDDVITCKWRLSGKANIGPAGLTIKPYIVYSDFAVEQGLIVSQEDRFSLPSWDILLSSLFPFLIGKVRCATGLTQKVVVRCSFIFEWIQDTARSKLCA